jgi:dipeptidyl aminopeptidase/acylaminoacyl peptidase
VIRNALRSRAAAVSVGLGLLVGCSAGNGPAASGPRTSTPSTPIGTHSATATPETTTGALRGQLLFTRTSGDDEQALYLLSGGHERRISAPGDYCCVVQVSPDRRRILVLPGGDIPPPVTGGTIDLQGGDFRRLKLTDPKLNLIPTTWSPDGSRIAYLGWDDTDPGRRGLFTSTSDGRDVVRVTTRPGPLDDVPLDYSPDGGRLVFYRSAHPDPDPHTDGSLWVVNVDGSGLHRITKPTAPPADWAQWSPDGRHILFADQRTSPTGAVWTVEPDGSHLIKLFSDPQGRFPIAPLWSPDGTSILFALDPSNDAFKHEPNGLYTVTADGTQLRLVLGGNDFKAPKDWWW